VNINEAIKFLLKEIKDPAVGLPEEIFEFITKITPIINVDLLIKDKRGRTLLSWRDDDLHGKGWHVPGGIVRFREKFEERIKMVAKLEIGYPDLIFDSSPITITQIINKERDIRGHFISLLYRCFIPDDFIPDNRNLSSNDNGYLKWHNKCPEDLLMVQEIYRKYI